MSTHISRRDFAKAAAYASFGTAVAGSSLYAHALAKEGADLGRADLLAIREDEERQARLLRKGLLDRPCGDLLERPGALALPGEVDRALEQLDGLPGLVAIRQEPVRQLDGAVERRLVEEHVAARGEVAVVGVPHPDLGAVLVCVLTDPADHVRLAAVARTDLSEAARPRRWYLLPALPTTDTGKVDRAALARTVEAGRNGLRPLTTSTVVP